MDEFQVAVGALLLAAGVAFLTAGPVGGMLPVAAAVGAAVAAVGTLTRDRRRRIDP